MPLDYSKVSVDPIESGKPGKVSIVSKSDNSLKPIISDRKCSVCGLYWLKNHSFGARGEKKHTGYYHRCGASASGKFDGNGEFLRVDLQMKPNGWSG